MTTRSGGLLHHPAALNRSVLSASPDIDQSLARPHHPASRLHKGT
jgi:hypothetical protein